MEKDSIIFKDKFSFDKDTTKCFTNMISRSIPDYNNMRNTVFNVSKHFVKHKTDIVDIGSSNGESILPFVRKFGALNMFRLIDNSKPMIEELNKRYKGFVDCGIMSIDEHDLRNGLPMKYNASVILSILTLQFVPIEYRKKILSDIYSSLIDGGCFVIVEKLICDNEKVNEVAIEEYYNIKRNNGYTDEQILAKKKALENVLIPLTENMNKDLIKSVGFTNIECIWRCLNFAAYICIK